MMPGSKSPKDSAMYAIIEDSGSQYKIGKGDVIHVDARELADGAKTVKFDKVLLIGGDTAKIGTPYLAGASVTAELLAEELGEKVTIVKFKRRKNYKRKRGHRQQYLKVKVTEITG